MFSMRRTPLRLTLAITILTGAACLQAQDEPPTSQQQGRGAQSTREFLGLGPAPDAAAAALGEPLYQNNCGTCHGPTGRGAQGPNLVRSTLVLHDEKGEALAPVIKDGRPQGGMPAFPTLSSAQIYNISQYLHLQVELTANRGTYGSTYAGLRGQTSGDARRGEAYFSGPGGCTQCHSAGGDLAKVGSKYPQPAAIQTRMLWPVSQGPAKVTVKLASGKTISGKLKSFTDFDVSLIDADGRYHGFSRDRVTVEIADPIGPHRALLPKYSDADIHDLAAYLVTLK